MSDNKQSQQVSTNSEKHVGGGRNYAFDRTNFLFLAIGFAIVIIGFILMSGPGSTEQAYNPDIFSSAASRWHPSSVSSGSSP
jgi:hypothetical protein